MNRNLLIIFNFFMCLFLLTYFMGNNPYEYLQIVYFRTMADIAIFSGVIFCINLVIYLNKQNYKKYANILDLFVFLYFLFLDILILNFTLFPNSLLKCYIISYIIQVVVFCAWHCKTFKISLPILLIFVVFNATKYSFSIFEYEPSQISYGNMKYKPNIYLLILESYQGNEALTKLYSYDNSDFLRYLQDMNFKIYENVYSNAPNTRASLSSVFEIKDLTQIAENQIDKILTEPDKYKTTNTLLVNGYNIEYLFPTDYLTQSDSRCINNINTASLFLQKYFKQYHMCSQTKYHNFDDYISKLTDFITKKRKKPFLFITKIGGVSENENTYSGGLIHIPNAYRHTNRIDLLPILRKNYIDELKKENDILKSIIKEIQKFDSNGLIVMIGDHGADFLEIYKRKYSNEIKPFLKKNNIDQKDFLLDFYNILLAIKWPNYIKEYDEKIQIAPELFKIIFEKTIPELKISSPSLRLFDFDSFPLTDIYLERIK